jgi:hypothetical protein
MARAAAAARTSPPTRFTIYGERCSGTTYVETLMATNFDLEVTWAYGWKHFFGHCDPATLARAHDTVFVCVVRDPVPWLNSLYRNLHHLPLKRATNLGEAERLRRFLHDEVRSEDEHRREILHDRHMRTGAPYASLLELRHVKLRYLIEELPRHAPRCALVRYEDLVHRFHATMVGLRDRLRLPVRPGVAFPRNSPYYKSPRTGRLYDPRRSAAAPAPIAEADVCAHPHFDPRYEVHLAYEAALGRPPDASGAAFYASELRGGRMGLEQLRRALRRSPEAARLHARWVRRAYRAVLRRDPDRHGTALYGAAFRDGRLAGEDELRRVLRASREYAAAARRKEPPIQGRPASTSRGAARRARAPPPPPLVTTTARVRTLHDVQRQKLQLARQYARAAQ